MDVPNEPTEGFSPATLGAVDTSSPDASAAAVCSQQAGGPGLVRRCDDCGRDTYSLTQSICAPCRTAGDDEMSGDELWPLVELEVMGGEG
jgi:hypothetical protein